MSATLPADDPAVTAIEVKAAGDGNGGAEPSDEMERPRRLRPLLWRLHFFGGFLAAPIAVWLSITGILIAWNPQIEDQIHGDKFTTSSTGEPVPVSEQVEAVLEAYPGVTVVDITPSPRPRKTTAVQVVPAGVEPPQFGGAPGQFTAYVDPVTTEITGTVNEQERPKEWIQNLHSNFHLGEGTFFDGGAANTLTELSASWVLVSILTGIYLWWPKTMRGLKRSLVPRFGGLRSGRRKPWRDLHSTFGILLLVLVAGMVVTGLTWTEYAGSRVDTFKEAVNSASPSLSTSVGGEEGEGGEAAEGAHAEHQFEATGGVDPEALDRVALAAETSDLEAPYIIKAGGPGEAWTVGEDNSRWPRDEAEIAVDPASGAVIDRLEFGDNALLDQLTSMGISFHDGSLFGPLNQILLTVLAVGIIVLIISGYMTWWRRRPKGGLGAPPKPGPLLRTTPVPLLIGAVVLMYLLPTLAVSFIIYLVIERIIWAVRGGGRSKESKEPEPAPA